jgi:hypothetical protein
MSHAHPDLRSALVTGTALELARRRPLPRVLAERRAALVSGPSGVGRTLVARAWIGPGAVEVDAKRFETVCVARMRTRRWPDALAARGPLVLDLADYLGTCRKDILVELLTRRDAAGLRTAVCLGDALGMALLGSLPAGSAALIALHFPSGRKARLAYAREVCDEFGLDRCEAPSTLAVDFWSYEGVREALAVRRGAIRAANATDAITGRARRSA